MTVSGTINTVTLTTSSGTVSFEKSVAHISGTFTGRVSLQTAPVGTTDWVTIMNFEGPAAEPINTPDTTMIFRFYSHLNSGSANVYLGA